MPVTEIPVASAILVLSTTRVFARLAPAASCQFPSPRRNKLLPLLSGTTPAVFAVNCGITASSVAKLVLISTVEALAVTAKVLIEPAA